MPAAVPGAGDHRIVVDVQDVGIDLGARVAAGQFGGVPPVRGAAAVIEQAGVAQDEGAAADAQHARAAVDRPAQRLDQVFGEAAGRARRAGTRIGVQAQALVTDRGQGDQVGLFQALQAVGGLQGEVERAQRRRLAGHHGEVVARQPVVGAVDPEHFADGAELERQEAVHDHDGDVPEHVPSMPRSVKTGAGGWRHGSFGRKRLRRGGGRGSETSGAWPRSGRGRRRCGPRSSRTGWPSWCGRSPRRCPGRT